MEILIFIHRNMFRHFELKTALASFNHSSAEIDFRRQNLGLVDPRTARES